MRLIMQFIYGDGCTFSGTESLPIVSDSPEQALCDFSEAFTAARKVNPHGEFTFGGHEFAIYNFFEDNEFYPPEFFTLDEWFEEVEQAI